MSTLELRPVTPDENELALILKCLQQVWPDSKRMNAEYLRWLYFENPAGKVIGFNAWDADKIAGHYVTVPIRAIHNGMPAAAALSLNTAVHENYRGQGLFKTLAEKTYTLAAEMGVDHIVGVANANSTAGFVRSLKFQLVGYLDAKIFAGSPNLAPPRKELAWKRLWTEADLGWRLRNPAAVYTYQRRNAALEINGPTSYFGLKAALKFITDADQQHTVQAALVPQPYSQPRLWIGLNPSLKFNPLASIGIPYSLRKTPLNLIFRSLKSPGKTLARENIEFTGIDFDVV